MKAIFDSDVLIDFLQGLVQARDEIKKYSEPCYSVISWMEVMSGAETSDETTSARRFLSAMKMVNVTGAIAEKAVEIRKANRVKLPDAIILATADIEGCILVTRNIKDFDASDPRVRIPYSI